MQISHAVAFGLPFEASPIPYPLWELSLNPSPAPSIPPPQPTLKPLPPAPVFPNSPPPAASFGKASPKHVPLSHSSNKGLGKRHAANALSPPTVTTSEFVTEQPHSAPSLTLQDPDQDVRLQETLAANLAMMNYSQAMQLPLNHSPFATTSSLRPQIWNSKDLAEAEDAHKVAGDRM